MTGAAVTGRSAEWPGNPPLARDPGNQPSSEPREHAAVTGRSAEWPGNPPPAHDPGNQPTAEPRERVASAEGSVVVACCQLAPVLGDRAANRELAASAVADAAARGASVIVLPELMSSGYVFESQAEARASAEPPDGPTVTGWARLAAQHDVVIVGGFCELNDDQVHNSAALVDPDGLRCVYRKAHLWDRERLWFAPGGAAPPVVDTRFGRIAVMICYDLEFPEWVRLPALDGAQLLCAPVNWPAAPRPAGERPAEVIRVQADAGVNRMFIAVCDRTGLERGAGWVAGSIIVDADGWPLASATPGGGPVTIMADCRLADARDKAVSPLSDIHLDRRPELYGPVAEPVRPVRLSSPAHAQAGSHQPETSP